MQEDSNNNAASYTFTNPPPPSPRREEEEDPPSPHHQLNKKELKHHYHQHDVDVSHPAHIAAPKPPAQDFPQGGAKEGGVEEEEQQQPPVAEISPATPPRAFAPEVTEEAPIKQQQQQQQQQERIDLLRAKEILASSAGVPKVRPHWTHRYLRILIIGQNGVGRTTLLRNLFGSYAKDPAHFIVADGSMVGARRAFAASPGRLATELVVKDVEQKVHWHYIVQDTPGLGDTLSSSSSNISSSTSYDIRQEQDRVLDMINQCHRAYYNAERDPDRRQPLSDLADTRIDVCLYLLPPHTLHEVDLEFMGRLCRVVPVIPVLAKADAMTSEELAEFRGRVASMFERGGGGGVGPHYHHRQYQPSYPISSIIKERESYGTMWRFSSEAIQATGEAGAQRGPPFATICSHKLDQSIGHAWPVRQYSWGKCEALLSDHSDLVALRKLLFETGFWELKEATERAYHAFRAKECSATARSSSSSHGVTSNKNNGGLIHGVLKAAASIAVVGAATLLIVNRVGPFVRDSVKRRETVKRVKQTVGGAVETMANGVQDVSTKAGEVAESAKEIGMKALRAVESEEARKKREQEEKEEEEEEARRKAKKKWFRFWG